MEGLFDLTGKTAIITGSSRGIGEAMAHRFAEQGARVVVTSRNRDACAKVADAINRATGRDAAIAIAADLGDKTALKAMVEEAHARLGAIDILVCNGATSGEGGPMLEVSDEGFTETLRLNILSNNWLVQLVAPGMIDRKDGAIIITSSIGGYRGNPGMGPYSISKAGDMAMVRTLARELGKHNIRVNAIAPGLVKTELARDLWENPTWAAGYIARSALGRLGEPDDLAGIAVFLAARAGAWTTGQVFVVDGGAMA